MAEAVALARCTAVTPLTGRWAPWRWPAVSSNGDLRPILHHQRHDTVRPPAQRSEDHSSGLARPVCPVGRGGTPERQVSWQDRW